MKILTAIFCLLVTTQAFCFDLCSYQEISDLQLEKFKISKNPKRFTFAEKNLIHWSISLQSFYEGISRQEALKLFNEGSNEGEVVYFQVEGVQLILVHYWPGDNEYGAFYELRTEGISRLLAKVEDGFITCEE